MSKIVQLPALLGADEHSHANAERTRRLFEWATMVLTKFGHAKAVAQATSIAELRDLVFDANDAVIALAVRDALYPATGERGDHFRGLREGSLKRILRNRFDDMKWDREKVLRSRAGAGQRDWTDDLILDQKKQIVPNLANLLLILHKAPKWRKVLTYDEFNARVVIRERPPWGQEEPGTPWTDHHESLARVWFQIRRSMPQPVTWGELCRRRQSTIHSIRCARISSRLFGTEFRGSTRGSSFIFTRRTANTFARSRLGI
jgi:hypothetical protein